MQVRDRRPGREVLLVGLGERVAEPLRQLADPLLAELLEQRVGEVVGPRPGGLDQPRSSSAWSTSGTSVALGHPDDEVQPRQHRLGHPRGVVDGGAVERLPQDPLHLQPDLRGVPVAGQVDQAGHEPAVGVAAQEQLGLPALLQVQHGQRDRQQVLAAHLEQLVARVGLQDLQQVLAVVAVRQEPGRVEHLPRLAPQHRDPQHALGVRRRREQPEEPPLTDDVALGVEGLHADVVQVHGPVHGGARVRLGQDQQPLLPGRGPRRRAAARRRTRTCPGRCAGCPARCRDGPPARRPPSVSTRSYSR